MSEKMRIDVPTSPRGVAVAKSRVAQRLRHLEKTRDQKSPTTVKTMLLHFLARLEDQRREGRVYIHKEQCIDYPWHGDYLWHDDYPWHGDYPSMMTSSEAHV